MPDIPENISTAAQTDTPKIDKIFNRWAVWGLRIVLGVTFVFSGIVKSFDPWGFIFKIEEYLGVWGMNVPRTVILVGAIGLSMYEFVFGVMLTTGCMKRWAPRWLLLSMVVMLPLTAYILIDGGVDDCGCFGDAFKISNTATFLKNVFITIGLIYLLVFNSRVKSGLFAPAVQWIVGVVSVLYIMFISLFGYNIQPLMDFREYPIGTDVAELTRGEEFDISSYQYKYEKDGVEKIFTADNLPDSTWTYVDRLTPVDTSIDTSKLAIFDGDEDVTEYVIEEEGEQLLIIIPEPSRADISYSYAANEFNSYITARGGSMIGLIGGGEDAIKNWLDLSMSEYPCYTVDDTTLKSMARGIMSMIYLRDGKIVWKRTLLSIDYETLEKVSDGSLPSLEELKIDDKRIFRTVTFIYLSILVVIALFQHGIGSLISFFSKKKQKNNVNLQTEKQINSKN